MKKEIIVSVVNQIDETPVANLVQKANAFTSSIYLEQGALRVNAKSFMGLMNLVIARGSRLTIDAEGADAEEAIAAMEEILTGRG